MKKKLDISPETSVYGTYKRLSYTPASALAEFVDNSTQSYFDHKDELLKLKNFKNLEIEITYNEINDTITITDNAFGMDYYNFTRAIILDKPPLNVTPNSRNEYGMGLKTAACWFGNYWTVTTTAYGEKKLYRATIDVDGLVIHKNKEIDFDEDDCSEDAHFTRIEISKLNQKIKGKNAEKKIHNLLSSIYREDLRQGNIKISYNGNLLVFEETEPYIDNNGKKWLQNIDFSIEHNGKQLTVKGYAAIRIPGSLENAGFALLRRNRVIIGGPNKNFRPKEIFGPQNSFAYQRLYGELKMDNWPVTQAKDNFDWATEDLEEKFIEKLKETLDKEGMRKAASEIKAREKTNIDAIAKTIEHIIPENEHISNVSVTVVDKNTGEYSINEKTEPKESNDLFGEEYQESNLTGFGVEIQEKKDVKLSFCRKNVLYKFTITYDDNNDFVTTNWSNFEVVDDETHEYKLTINAQHPFFYPYINKMEFLAILSKFAVAMALSEIEAYNTASNGLVTPSQIRINMGDILIDLTKGE